ncbi:hypothetical protein OA07_24460 [Aphanizomenon flos-aquae 2012/KM1/D3]|nr:hypothetical protein OA07_24460 [Aphanizomenon flos-aquae 2012/KM1/D3]
MNQIFYAVLTPPLENNICYQNFKEIRKNILLDKMTRLIQSASPVPSVSDEKKELVILKHQ